MQSLLKKSLAGLAIAATMVATSGSIAAQDVPQLPQVANPQPGGVRSVRPTQRRVENLRSMILLNDPNSVKAVKKIELGKFWIGLNCADVSPALRSQLKLKDGVGLLVINAFEGSPSQEAGLKQHDIIVQADGKEIGAVGQLIEAVQKAGESEIKLDIVREGQQKTITVKSAERPSEQQGQVIYLPNALDEHRLLFRTPHGGFTFIEPGVVVAPNHSWVPARPNNGRLPAGVSITVTRKAGDAVAIHVEQNEKKWDITEDEIDQLPKDLQPHVKAMLLPNHPFRYMPHRPEYRTIPQTTYPPAPQSTQTKKVPRVKPLGNNLPKSDEETTKNAKPVESEIEKLKRELSEEMKQLRKAINELKESSKQK